MPFKYLIVRFHNFLRPKTNISRILSRKKFNSRVIFVDIWSKRVFYGKKFMLFSTHGLIFGFDGIGRVLDRFWSRFARIRLYEFNTHQNEGL